MNFNIFSEFSLLYAKFKVFISNFILIFVDSSKVLRMFMFYCCDNMDQVSDLTDSRESRENYGRNKEFYPCGHWKDCSFTQNHSETRECSDNEFMKNETSMRCIPQLSFGNSPVWPLSGSCRVRNLFSFLNYTCILTLFLSFL